MSHVHLNNIENEKVSPTANIIEKYYEAWGIDLYMYAVAKYSDPDRVPRSLRSAVESLVETWSTEIDEAIGHRKTRAVPKCSEFRG